MALVNRRAVVKPSGAQSPQELATEWIHTKVLQIDGFCGLTCWLFALIMTTMEKLSPLLSIHVSAWCLLESSH